MYKVISKAIDEDRFVRKSINIVQDKVYIRFDYTNKNGDSIKSEITLPKYYKTTDCEDSYNLIVIGNDYLNKNVDSSKEEVEEKLKDSPSENMSELISKLDPSYIDTFAKYKHDVLEDILIDNLLRIGCPKHVACADNMEDIYCWLLCNYGISYSFSIFTEKSDEGSYSKQLHMECIDANKYCSVFSYSRQFTNENDYRSSYYALNNFAISAICSHIYINRFELLP